MANALIEGQNRIRKDKELMQLNNLVCYEEVRQDELTVSEKENESAARKAQEEQDHRQAETSKIVINHK